MIPVVYRPARKRIAGFTKQSGASKRPCTRLKDVHDRYLAGVPGVVLKVANIVKSEAPILGNGQLDVDKG